MYFQVDKQKLSTAIQIVQRAAATSTNMPILSGIYLKAAGDQLEIRATDLDFGIEYTLPVKVREEGEIVLPAKYLTEMIRRFNPGEVALNVEEGGYTAHIKAGRASFDLLGFPPAEYPVRIPIAGEKAWQVEQSLLREMIEKTAFAASKDSLRPILTGVLMSFKEDSLELVATDSHRLAFYRTPLAEKTEGEEHLVVPAKTLEELLRNILAEEEETVTISTGSGQIFFQVPGVTMTSRLLEGNFIDYRQVLPTNYETRVRVNTGEFLAGVERAAVLTHDKASSIRIEMDEAGLRLFANTPEVGQVEEEIRALVQGEDVIISFNSRYLMEVLRVFSAEELFLDITGSVSPGIIRPVQARDDYLHLIMPVTTRAAVQD